MPSSTKTVLDIIPDLDFDKPSLGNYYSTRADENYGNGEED